MSEVIRDIRRAYKGICNAKDPRSAYLDLHTFLDETRPQVEILEELPQRRNVDTQDFINRAVQNVRQGKLEHNSNTYFLGSGIMTAGDSDGNILAVDYSLTQFDKDPVALEHGPYQYMAVKKLGFAALTARLHISLTTDTAKRGFQEDRLFLELGLTLPRYLGHAVRMLSTAGSFITAGASGMLPSIQTTDEFAKNYPQIVSSATKQGISRHDVAAGLHDTVAAHSLAWQLGRVSRTSAIPDRLVAYSPTDFSPTTNIH